MKRNRLRAVVGAALSASGTGLVLAALMVGTPASPAAATTSTQTTTTCSTGSGGLWGWWDDGSGCNNPCPVPVGAVGVAGLTSVAGLGLAGWQVAARRRSRRSVTA